MSLTDTAIRSAKPQEKPIKLFDGGGLFLLVTPNGGKWWRLKYRFGGKEKLLSLGVYPAISLKEARKSRDQTKEQIALGIDPGANRKAVKEATKAEAANSFEVVAREWYGKQKDTWVQSHGDKILARFVNDIFPLIGAKPVNTVTAPELLEALRRIETRGAVETAHRTLQNCGQVFRYAIATGRAERDPAADLRGALSAIKHTSFASITEPREIGALLRDIHAYQGNLIVCAALRMAPYVFARPGELRRAEWAEFNLDAKEPEWRIPGGTYENAQVAYRATVVAGRGNTQRFAQVYRRWTLPLSEYAGQVRPH